MFKNVELKVGIFILASLMVILTTVGFIAYKKGIFSENYVFHLSSRSGDGLSKGTPVLFSGFEIGRVKKLELSSSGVVLITVETPKEHSRWIRETSIFVLDKPLMGSPKIIVKTPDMRSEILPGSKVIEIQTVDGINEAIAKIKPILERIEGTVRNVEAITATFSDKKSLMAMATGDNTSGEDLAKILHKSAELSASLHAVVEKADRITANTDERLYGKEGIVNDLKSTLKKLDEILKNGSKISADAAASTTDLAALRSEIDMAIRNTNSLIRELESKIPMQSSKELTLP